MAIKDFDDVFGNEHDHKTVASRWTALKDKFSWKTWHSQYIEELEEGQPLQVLRSAEEGQLKLSRIT